MNFITKIFKRKAEAPKVVEQGKDLVDLGGLLRSGLIVENRFHNPRKRKVGDTQMMSGVKEVFEFDLHDVIVLEKIGKIPTIGSTEMLYLIVRMAVPHCSEVDILSLSVPEASNISSLAQGAGRRMESIEGVNTLQ